MSTETTLSPFPDILAPKSKKRTDDYGIQYAEAIWGVHTANVTAFNAQRQIYVRNIQYAEGLQSVDKYKKMKGYDNTSYGNLDFSPVNIIAGIVKNQVGRLMNIPYKVQCNAIDPESQSRFDEYRAKLYAEMHMANDPRVAEIQQRTGIKMVSQDAPKSSDEAELHLKMNYKDDASIAMEQALNYIFTSNDFEKSREHLLRDLIVNKKGALKYWYDEDMNIRAKWINHIDVITPYSKEDDFSNIPYIAHINNMTVGDIAVANPDFTDAEIYEIAKLASGRNGNAAWNNYLWGTSYEGYYSSQTYGGIRPFYNFNIAVLDFYFLGIDQEGREIKKVRNKLYINKKDINDEIKTDGTSEVITKKVQNLYQGHWIISTKYIFGYEQANNTEREKINGSYSPKAELPIIMIAPDIYDMQNKSDVEKAITHEDQINLANLTLQVMMIKAKPPGSKIDVPGLIEAARLLGKEDTPLELIKMYEQGGNIFTSSVDIEGQQMNSTGVTELKGGVSDAFMSLIQIHRYQRELINEAMSYNSAVDASSPNSEALVGVQKNAIIATNNALRPIHTAHLQLIERLCKRLSLMVQDCIEYDNEAFINAIGVYATKTLEYGKKLALAQIGIKIELLPDQEEWMQLDEQIKIGQQNKELKTSDVVRIRQMMKEDLKLAARLMVLLEDKNAKEAQDAQLQMVQMNGQTQQQSAQMASQMKQQELQIEIQSKGQMLQMEYQLKDAFEDKQFQRNLALQREKNAGIELVAQINAGKQIKVQEVANDGKLKTAIIEGNNQIAKTSIVHHTTHSSIDHKHLVQMEALKTQHAHDLEMQENEPAETTEEKD
jgi:hypothetical protein